MGLAKEEVMARTSAELMGLEVEAERLVRMGESRAEVSRRLGVSPQTLAGWALRGGWRKKDIELERQEEIARETIYTIRHGNGAVDRQNAARAKLKGFMTEAVELLAAGDEASLGKLAQMLGGVENQKRLVAPEVKLGPDPKTFPMSLGDPALDGLREPMVDEHGVPWTPERLRERNRGEAARARRRGGGGRDR
jgi:hypothetical protein